MFTKSFKLILAFLALSLTLSACTISTRSNSSGQSIDSSLFASGDRGDTWRSLTAIPTTSGRPGSISDLNVNLITMDPQDNKALYLASYDSGLFYTYNIVDGWNLVASLPQVTIYDVKVDPKSKCTVYAALSNRLYRSNDCTRTWTQIYFDNNPGVAVNTVVIDHYNTSNIYIGTSRGEIIKSIDSGSSWRTIRRLDEGVARLIISPLDSRLIFVASAKNNIYSFNSSSATNSNRPEEVETNFLVENWLDLNTILKEYNLGVSFRDIVVSERDGHIFLATEKVILRSRDNGLSFENIKLLQPEQEAVINSVAIDPKDSNNIYYVTNTTFFRSTDGGSTWTTKKLPTQRAGRELLIDFNNPNVIYLGTRKIK